MKQNIEAALEHAAAAEGAEMMSLIKQLFPLCRSITGDGVRQTLKILSGHIPLEMFEVPSGTPVLDWKVPREWNVKDAYVADSTGKRVIDFAASNLHLMHYSPPMDAQVSLEELKRHLHTIPEHPDWIPYRTSYYSENWGFCLSHRQLATLTDNSYRVVIDSSLTQGSLTYGECLIKGRTDETVLISCHICHPSMANDNLSGIAVAVWLAKALSAAPRNLSYRFLFIPGTIGSITWLAHNEATLGRIRHGLVLSCLGDSGAMNYKQSRRANAPIDKIVAHVLKHDGSDNKVRPFIPYGYDERQYCSPGYNLPVGCLMRTPNGEFPEYHSSADNLSFVHASNLAHSLDVLLRIIAVIEGDATYCSLNPKGEPQLGRRGLYPSQGGHSGSDFGQMALLWVLSLADGGHSLLDTAERSGLAFSEVRAAADGLIKVGLLEPV